MQRILISGASVAGPVLAYWLRRYGFEPTVVERTPALRHGLGGHAVDLFGSGVEVARRMELWAQIHEARTQTTTMSVERHGKRPVTVDIDRLSAGISDRHVEILRGELTKLLYEATRSDVEYVFGDSIATLDDDGDGVDVTFEHAAPRRFDLVIGADGMHSTVRRLVFGPEEAVRRHLGGYLAVYSMPDLFALQDRMLVHVSVDRMVSTYGVHQTGQARAAFLFRTATELPYDYRDREQQRRIVADAFGEYGWTVPRLLEHLAAADDFYFDAISQITLDSWQRGRVGLVGDAGFCPGPAIGGGTSLAAVTAYVLAGELAAARSDLPSGLRNYERKVREFVDLSRAAAPKVMKSVIPGSATAVRLVPWATAMLVRLPTPVQKLVWAQNGVGKALGSLPLPNYSDLIRTP
ncbi:2-polyprenyl-6-methoxyphenol hydroxylase-like FAD-dependent oxidoreductase [Kribbella amoyensis]|uniref:2-polyprenyl-6-methoxyphenol hydroxylase-like FAD-dependent oxidoreductase n=1 Tax=Kribbella amoyensis TaxID=996641 RepID=A0A561BVS9_9ACTN|nr:FAD-dependent monooxygenase [Kribbella amoyensis]TWD82979.1 2-polyprenyl-6-methoxyphenol hydroxylase-like FAD-dependent oxidoreductase [Kribbella amoyensis]